MDMLTGTAAAVISPIALLSSLWFLRRRVVLRRRDEFFRRLGLDPATERELLASINRKKRSRQGKPAAG